jgi:2-oxo-4-hydroxy-4-carboxy-5-ureidoimidazoline decarboxylase
MSPVLAQWNAAPLAQAIQAIVPSCGSSRWAEALVSRRPILSDEELLALSDTIWNSLQRDDWLEAFRTHPRIGERTVSTEAPGQSAVWSAQEQNGVASSASGIQKALAEGNQQYEQRFGRTFIVCATGKSAEEMLGILRIRMQNDPGSELQESAEQQRQITRLRLRKWLGQ